MIFFRAPLAPIRINALAVAHNNKVLVGTDKVLVYDTQLKKTDIIPHKGTYITRIYPDKKGAYWITTASTGVNRVDSLLQHAQYYELTPQAIVNQTEQERHVFFEDSQNNLWLGVHGGGLSLFNESTLEFQHFRNNPLNSNSISSNFIHCITEDQFGTIWVGTGQPFGSINKIITRHPGAKNIIQQPHSHNNSENVVRGLLEDSNGNIWVSTKKGMVYIYDNTLRLIHSFAFAPLTPQGAGFNVYTIFQDSKGYIWMGAKNRGIGVTKTPLPTSNSAYKNLTFNYHHHTNSGISLIHNAIYSITEDHLGRIWIGTFSKGIDLLDHPSMTKSSAFTHLNTETTNLKSNNIRFLYRDTHNNMWVATAYGLYVVSAQNIEKNHFEFDAYFQNTGDNAISYNDIVHLCEDAENRLWIATLGGGFSLLNKPSVKPREFVYFSQQDGLSNDEVHSITADNYGTLWVATENGLNHFNPETQSFKQYSALNRLTNTSFSESTAIKLRNGSILLGTRKRH